MRNSVDPKSILEALSKYNPFPYPEPREGMWKILAVTSAVKLFQERLEDLFRIARENSVITAVVGRARAGKTHFLKNLEWRINEKREYGAITIYINLTDEKLRLDDVLDRILLSELFIREASKLGINLEAVSESDRKKKVNVINEFVKRVQTRYDVDVGIVLIVDNFDEYLRQIRGITNDEDAVRREIERLLGVFRLLITEVPRGLLTIFSLTEDARDEIDKNYLVDPTLRGRFLFINDDRGNPATLSKITMEEALEIVRVYMEHWAENVNLSLPEIEACTYGGKNVFPFTPDAVDLFLRAGEVAGYICFGCQWAIATKTREYKSEDTLEIKDLIITRDDAAKVIQRTAVNWPAYKSVESEVRSIVVSKFVERMIREWKPIGNIKYGTIESETFKVAFRKGFEYYLKKVLEEEGAIVNSDVYISHLGRDYVLHYIVTLAEDKKVGLLVTKSKRIRRVEGYPLSLALRIGKATHGVFVYYGEEKYDPITRKELPVLDSDLIEELITPDLNYTPVVRTLRIDPETAWALVFLQDQEDENLKQEAVTFVENELRLVETIKKLVKETPRTFKSTRYRPPKPGDLLDRGGA